MYGICGEWHIWYSMRYICHIIGMYIYGIYNILCYMRYKWYKSPNNLKFDISLHSGIKMENIIVHFLILET